MKKLFKFTPLILLLIFSISCTEEISDDLKNSDASLNETSIAEKKVGKKMSLKHLMDEDLFSHYLHSSKGKDYPCELEADANNFQSGEYDKTDSDHALDCILEVEELDLTFEGVEYQLNIDEYLCEYVEYQPFSYFFAPAGRTTRTLYKVICDSSCSNADPSSSNIICDSIEGTYRTYDMSRNEINDGVMTPGYYGGRLISSNSFSNKVSNPDETNFCQFHHQPSDDININCDIGYVTTKEIGIYGTDSSFCSDSNFLTAEDCVTNEETWTEQTSCSVGTGNIDDEAYIIVGDDTTQNCNGEINNCVAGPIKEQVNFPDEWGEVFENRELNSFSKSWSVSPTFGRQDWNNMDIANYSKIFSKTSADPDIDAVLTNFLGHEIETYAPTANEDYLGDSDVKNGYVKERVDHNNDGENDYVMYNKTPFLSIYERDIKPYYAFYCLDQAYNIKAQIRLFIREWDREFDTDSSTLDYLSDCDEDSVADCPNDETTLMDNPYYQDGDYLWNNVIDWDNFFYGLFNDDNITDPINVANGGTCYQLDALSSTPADCSTNSGTWIPQAQKCYSSTDLDVSSKTNENQTDKHYCENDLAGFWKFNSAKDISNNFPSAWGWFSDWQ